MAAKDIYHNHARNALINDGWTITHDPLRLKYGKKYTLVDLAAERLLAAEKGACKIAVEVKSVVGKSSLADLEKALGQFTLYSDVLEENEPDRTLYLAIRASIFDEQAPHKTFFDVDADNYAIIEVGWENCKRVHQFIIHLEIINGKVWLQADNTDLVIADDLERAGIPKSDIVLGFHPPHIRPLIEYAAA